MSNKILPFILGLAVGAALCAAVLLAGGKKFLAEPMSVIPAIPHSDEISDLKTQLADAKSQLVAALADNDKLAASVQESLKQKNTALASAAKPKKASGMAALFGGDGTNGMSEAMNKMMKTAIQQQMDAKFAGMKAKLNLSPDQEKAIREIMDNQASRGAEITQKWMKGELTAEEMAKMGKEPKTEEEQIKALLSPEQVAAYDEYEKEEKTRMARLAANSELMQMQSALRLSEEQQDKVFEVLVSQTQAQFDWKNTNPADGVDILRNSASNKLAALQGVLTPEQLESYRKFQEQQMKMIEAFMPNSGTNATIQVIPVVSP